MRMKHGFIKVAAVTPEIQVADVTFNTEQIKKAMDDAKEYGVKVLVFPELALTGYTCADLFYHDVLLEASKQAILDLAEYSKHLDMIIFVGTPLSASGKLYNCAAVLNRGAILGFITKTFLPNYAEFYEMRQFTPGPKQATVINFNGDLLPFGPRLLFQATTMEELIVSGEICEDVWAPVPPSIEASLEGAIIIANCSASNEVIGKDAYRKELIKGQSARLLAGYIYANAGHGESTTDVVFGGHNIIAEDGTILKESRLFQNSMTISEIDLMRLLNERRKNTTYRNTEAALKSERIPFYIEPGRTFLTRSFPKHPFVPSNPLTRHERCEDTLQIQTYGLMKRLSHTKTSHVVLGISGGLDSTLALLVVVRAFEKLGLDKKNIRTVTMPCFGTTDRTYHNAVKLARILGTSFQEVSIEAAVLQHFQDIGHDPEVHDVTYENSQARERTQVLMDIANQINGLVIGTGDMSELALGWATYNGDHMSMYGVNVSVPKTLVMHLVAYCADISEDPELKSTLRDILRTPVSPELIPPKDGEITQKTEDLVGPYELHDFFLFYFLRYNYQPDKIYRIACITFDDDYDKVTILKWLEVFCRRFFSQQFKRSCVPDGPKVGSVALSPRGDLRMPSDACVKEWLKNLGHVSLQDI